MRQVDCEERIWNGSCWNAEDVLVHGEGVKCLIAEVSARTRGGGPMVSQGEGSHSETEESEARLMCWKRCKRDGGSQGSREEFQGRDEGSERDSCSSVR